MEILTWTSFSIQAIDSWHLTGLLYILNNFMVENMTWWIIIIFLQLFLAFVLIKVYMYSFTLESYWNKRHNTLIFDTSIFIKQSYLSCSFPLISFPFITFQWTLWKRCKSFGRWRLSEAPNWKTGLWWFTNPFPPRPRPTFAMSHFLEDLASARFRWGQPRKRCHQQINNNNRNKRRVRFKIHNNLALNT